MVAISIISPSFNQAAFVQLMLDSVAKQDFEDYEHIIFDGGSTDGTLDLLSKAAAGEKRISLHVGKDTGQSNAINLGLRQAAGSIVSWLNTDDYYISPTVLSEVNHLFATMPDVDVIYGRGRFVDSDGKVLRDAYINGDAGRLRHRFMVSVGILQPGLFFRRELLDKFGYLDETMNFAFDYEYWVRLVFRGSKWWFYDKDLVHATWHDQAKTRSARGRSFEESIEVCKRYYRFAPMDWVERLAGYQLSNADFVIISPDAADLTKRGEMEQRAAELFAAQNDSQTAQAAILQQAHIPETKKSLVALQSMSGLSWERVIVTTFDEAYFDQGLTLVASLHRNEASDLPIVIYDLGLSKWQRSHLETLRGVFVVEFPRELAPPRPDFFHPKSYLYKLLAITHARHFAAKRGIILWIDAGVSITEKLDAIFEAIARDGVFFVDHDDRPMQHMCNITFTSDACITAMRATNDELLAPHLCSCLMGYTVGGRYADLFLEALGFAGDPNAGIGDKHPSPPVRIERVGGEAADRERRLALEDRDFRAKLDHANMRRLFGYLGHRQDQSILSVLAARYGAPLSSARKYCVSNDASSRASKLNWDSRGTSPAVKSSRAAGETFAPAVTIHHRGTYVDFRGLDFGVSAERPAIILGNGPSLKGFDFTRLKAFDVFGMNAAYRYWDEIGWYPRFYSCLDLVVGKSHAVEIARLIRKAPEYGIERFLLRRDLIDHLGPLDNSERIVDFDLLRRGTEEFARLPITTGSHTLIWAAALGFREIYLLGIDCNYVEVVSGARRGEGTTLEIAAETENPNYFFAGYQRTGDRYNIPNTSPDLHLNSWRSASLSVRDYGARVLNANLKSHVDVFDFCRLEDVEKGEPITIIPRNRILGDRAYYAPAGFASVAFERTPPTQFDECAAVFHVLHDGGVKSVMIDVGAHFGSSLRRFADSDWQVLAFEPDPSNREALRKRHGEKTNVIISDEAVSDTSGQEVAFYASEESSGISGLTAFRDSHREVARVKTVTLDHIVARHGLTRVDFLKIDVEGFEMAVLRGLDFAKLSPKVVLASTLR